MTNKSFFKGFSEEEEQRYVAEARAQYGKEEVDASCRLWNSYSEEKQAQIKSEGGEIYADLAALVGSDPTRAEVQAVIARWHQHMKYFYEPSVERLRGLGQLYSENPEFSRHFREPHPDLPEFMRAAIEEYCDSL